MKMEQAIDKITTCRINATSDLDAMELGKAIKIAEDAMQKQIAVKPIKTYVHGVIGTMYRCRKCNRLMKPYEHCYCDCGQKVMWDYDE